MKNYQKMNELVGSDATHEQIISWAYNNRILVCSLHLEEEFQCMEKSVEAFLHSNSFGEDEHDNWSSFLKAEYID